MEQDKFLGPVNIGSEEMVTINQLAKYAIIASHKQINIKNISGDEFKNKYGFNCPVGVRGRNSDNKLYREKMNWEPNQKLQEGINKTYQWIEKQIHDNSENNK